MGAVQEQDREEDKVHQFLFGLDDSFLNSEIEFGVKNSDPAT